MSKRQLLNLHRWLGLALLLPLLLQTTTGLMLVYKWPLAQWLDPAGMLRTTPGADLSAGNIVDRAIANWGESRVQRLYFPESDAATYFLLLHDSADARYYTSMDPGDGRVLREGGRWQFPVEAALQLHFQPLAGRTGNSMVLLTGLGLLALMCAAVVAWWPRRGRWRQSLAIRSGLRGRLMVRQFHRSLGILLLPVLALLAITGSLMALELVLQNTGSRPPGSLPAPSTGVAVDQAVALAQTIVPGARLRDISFPGGNIKVQFHAPERNRRAVHSVLVGGHPLQVLKHTPAQENTGWWVILLPIHSGDVLSPWGHRVVLVAGFLLLALCSFGAWLWLPDRARRK